MPKMKITKIDTYTIEYPELTDKFLISEIGEAAFLDHRGNAERILDTEIRETVLNTWADYSFIEVLEHDTKIIKNCI